jgi:hypothetical protein
VCRSTAGPAGPRGRRRAASVLQRRPAKTNLFRPLFYNVRVRRRVASRVPSIWVRAVRVG